jgi:predicted nucleic acid-binding protein
VGGSPELARRWLDDFEGRPIIPYDPSGARTWGVLAAAAQRRGRPRPRNDMWVVACCIRHGLPLVTLNQKDFVDFRQDGLDLVDPPE